MKIMIIGAQRTGKGLYHQLRNTHHEVLLLDEDHKEFPLTTEGNSFVHVSDYLNQEVYLSHHIQEMDAVITCTKNDEINAVLARSLKYLYKVPKAIAFIQKPEEAHIYQKLGVQTISPTSLGIKKVIEILVYETKGSIYQFLDHSIQMVCIKAPVLWLSHTVQHLSIASHLSIILIERNHQLFIPLPTTIIEVNDTIYCVVDEMYKQLVLETK